VDAYGGRGVSVGLTVRSSGQRSDICGQTTRSGGGGHLSSNESEFL
jgi:hypothetical protein